jgi:hypothetical protein
MGPDCRKVLLILAAFATLSLRFLYLPLTLCAHPTPGLCIRIAGFYRGSGMKKHLVLVAALFVLIGAVGCGGKHFKPPVLASDPTCADPTDHSNMFRSETGNNGDCEATWDLASEPHSPSANHTDLYLVVRLNPPAGTQPRQDIVELLHSKGHQLIYCVRPNAGNNPTPPGKPDMTCSPKPKPADAELGCNLYPFVDGVNGDPEAMKWTAVHRLVIAPLKDPAKECHYKMSFWIRKNPKDPNPIEIDPHIVIGTGGTRL